MWSHNNHSQDKYIIYEKNEMTAVIPVQIILQKLDWAYICENYTLIVLYVTNNINFKN